MRHAPLTRAARAVDGVRSARRCLGVAEVPAEVHTAEHRSGRETANGTYYACEEYRRSFRRRARTRACSTDWTGPVRRAGGVDDTIVGIAVRGLDSGKLAERCLEELTGAGASGKQAFPF